MQHYQTSVLPARPIRTSRENAFAHATVTQRFQTNLAKVIEVNRDFPASVVANLVHLGEVIAGNRPINELVPREWDAQRWAELIAPYRHDTWHDTDWFFAETWAFRLLLSQTRYFGTLHDPFSPLKMREIATGAPFAPIRRYMTEFFRLPDEEKLEKSLELCMWGNRADISFAMGESLETGGLESDELLLINHRKAAVETLLNATAPVHIILDNSGAELAGDLVLARAVHQITRQPVVLHLKFYPTYVSDTVVSDVYTFLTKAAARGEHELSEFSHWTTTALEQGDIQLVPDPFWCETLFLQNAPQHIADAFATGAMVIIKGDFNYRRAVRDTIWPVGTDPVLAMDVPWREVPHLLLRTMKSDTLVGVDEAVVSRLDQEEPGWRTAGKRGVVQLVG